MVGRRSQLEGEGGFGNYIVRFLETGPRHERAGSSASNFPTPVILHAE